MTRFRPAPLLALAAAALLAPAAATARTHHSEAFATPTHNIHCVASAISGRPRSRGIRCDVRSTTNAPLPKPRSCHFDFGFSYGVLAEQRRGQRLCVSDAVPRSHNVLHYGATWRRSGVFCRSRRAGLTCRNHGGHGFFISRDAQRVF